MVDACAVRDCPVPQECGGAACLPGAPAGCPTLPDCDESGDGYCHSHCYDDGDLMVQPDGWTCRPCCEDADYATRAHREQMREDRFHGEF